jgi:selenoprotein W-related protein
MAQELLSTFENEVHSVSLIPNRDGKGVFTIWHADMGVVWDRKTEGGFPEVKKLKQRVRDMVSPNKDLGHAEVTAGQTENCQDCPQPELLIEMIEKPGPNIAITYCTGCRWLLRASWMAQELLTTFEEELGSVTLIPHEPPPGAEFHIELNGQSVWDRTEKGGFPQITELKQMIRDEVAPTRDLGHADRKTHKSGDDLNEDDSASMRNYFGVS